MAEKFTSPVLTELEWRGFIQDITHDELDAALAEGPQTLYCGFDPSAKSLHVGNLVGLMALANFYRHGHRPLALVGGATGLIGDPSGKDQERELLGADILDENVEAISGQVKEVLERACAIHPETREVDAPSQESVPVVNNADWLKDWSYIDFLREVGRYFRVNVMLAKESVRARLEEREQGISYTEFSYMLIQAFDFLNLYENEGCRLQIGGSDQWGNITAGTDLIKRKTGKSAFGMSFPLITSADGKKLGKSVKGAVFLDPELTSPYEFYQYWVSQDDQDCGKLLRLFTFLSREEIEEMEQTIEAGENRGEVQRKLAYETTALIHGEEAVDKVVRASRMLFGEKIEGLTDKDLASIFADVPSTNIDRAKLKSGELTIIDGLVDAGLQTSRAASRRLIKQGGAYINNEPVDDFNLVLDEDQLASESMLVLRSGKKKYHVLRFIEE